MIGVVSSEVLGERKDCLVSKHLICFRGRHNPSRAFLELQVGPRLRSRLVLFAVLAGTAVCEEPEYQLEGFGCLN